MRRVIFIIVFLTAVFSVLVYKVSIQPMEKESQERVRLEIPAGSSVKQIAEILFENNLIKSKGGFLIHVILRGLETDLQAGLFILKPSYSASEIVNILQSGKAEEISVTIPEGYTIKDIDELLVQKGVIEAGEIQDCAVKCDFSSFELLPDSSDLAERGGKIEGYVFPDTYYISVDDFVPKFFLERLMTTFRKRILDKYPDVMLSSVRSIDSVIIMASLIEKETRYDDERAIVSGILWKRLDAGQSLGVDATVRYILEKPQGALTVDDLDVNSPYNTRKFVGLPPGPISSFSEKSFIAAVNPQDSPYWYYLHGSDGKIRYAKTNDEHNKNKSIYLK